jgi:C_GCAxxG_C_C family probable redox protein
MEPTSPEALAAALFEQGFSCGQAVLAGHAARFGLERDAALRVACAFGGGVARTGATCGAVNGALMVIGLAEGRTRVEDGAALERTYGAARTFLERFRAEHGSLTCRDLLGVDISTAEGHEAASARGLFRARCPGFVRSAARIVGALT